MSIESVMPSNHLILCRPFSFCLQSSTGIRVFSNELTLCIRWWNYWRFSFSLSPSNVYSGLISFRIDWFDLLAVQGTLKSLLRHHSSKASILQQSTFFMIQLSHPYMNTEKIIALSRWAFVGKVISLLLNMLSLLIIAFLPRRKHLLILWWQPLSAVILEPKKIKSVTVSIVSPSICHEVMGLDAMILVFWILSFILLHIHISLCHDFLVFVSWIPCFFFFFAFYYFDIFEKYRSDMYSISPILGLLIFLVVVFRLCILIQEYHGSKAQVMLCLSQDILSDVVDPGHLIKLISATGYQFKHWKISVILLW